MSGWDDFIKDINKDEGQQQANTPPAATSASSTGTQSGNGWGDFMKRINDEPAPTTEQQPTVLPQQTTTQPESASQNEPFQLRMAKQQATENEIRRRVQETIGGLADSSVKDAQQKRENLIRVAPWLNESYEALERVRKKKADKELAEYEAYMAGLNAEMDAWKASGLSSEEWYAQRKAQAVEAAKKSHEASTGSLAAKALSFLTNASPVAITGNPRARAAEYASEKAGAAEGATQDYNEANRLLNYANAFRWNDLVNDPDFEEKAKRGLEIAEADRGEATDRMIETAAWGDQLATSEDDPGIIRFLDMLSTGSTYSNPGAAPDYARVSNYYKASAEFDALPTNKWTDDQKLIYGYLRQRDAETNGKDAMYYGRSVNESINREARYKAMKEVRSNTSSGVLPAIGNAVAARGANLVAGVDFLDRLIEYGAKGYTTTQPRLGPTDYASAVDSAITKRLNESGRLKDDIPVIGGKGIGDAYQILMSTIDSGLAIAVGGRTGSLAIMAARAASSAFEDAKERGADDDAALQYGFLCGTAEAFFEKFSVDQLYHANFAKGMVKAIAAQGAIEMSEEIATSFANAISEVATLKENGELESSIARNVEAGMSYEEAEKRALTRKAQDILYDGLAGFISGGLLVGGKAITTTSNTRVNASNNAPTPATENNAQNDAETQTAPEDAPAPPAEENADTDESERLNPAPDETTPETLPPAENESGEKQEGLQPRPQQLPAEPNDSSNQMTPADSEAREDGGLLPKGAKRSQTESNTLSGVAEKLGGEQNPLYYMPVTERQTLTEAVNRVMADGVGEMERLAGKEHWTAADVDTAMTLYGKLQADGVQNRDFGAAQSWAKVIQSRGTSTAQALQAFSKWTRSGSGTASAVRQQLTDSVAENQRTGGRLGITQEQADRITNDVFKFGQDFDSLGENDAAGLRDLIRRMSDYRKTGTLIKKNFAKVLDKISDTDYLREFALRQMSAIADDATVQADFGQKLKTWQTLAQLFRLTTFNRNIGGNLTFGTLDTLAGDSLGLALDHLAQRFTGKREVGFDKGWFSSRARAAAVDALNRSILEVAGDVDMSGDMSKYGMTGSRTFKMSGTPVDRVFSRLEQILSYSLRSSDKFFRGKIEAGQTEALEGIKKNGPTKEDTATIAKDTADYRLFQNKGIAYGISKGMFHDVPNLIGIGGTVDMAHPQRGRQGGFGLGDTFNAYPGVPANLGVKLLEYSPANIAKGAVEFAKVMKDIKYGNYQAGAQNKAVMDMARGLAGVPILTALAAAFKTGLIKNWDDEDDLDAAAQNRAEGKTGVQINLDGIIRAAQGDDPEWRDGDDVMSVSWLEPLNAFLAVSSLLAADDSDDPAVSKYVKHTFSGAIQSVLDLPVMENISNIVDTFRYSTAEDTGGKIWDTAIGFAGDAITGMIPGVSGQTARTIDPYYRDVTADSEVQRIWNNVKNVVPGLRETLPVKQDNYGEPKMAPDSAVQRALNNFLLPGAINQIRQSDVSAAVNSLYEATGDANVVPDRKAPNSISVNGEKYTLTAEEKRDYQETYGNAFADSADRLLNTDEFAGLSDETKAEAMKQLEQLAAYVAKKDYLKQQGVDYSVSTNEKILALADEDPDEAVRYLTTREAITEATEDRDYDVLDQLLGKDGAYHKLGEEAQEMLSSIDGLKRLVSMRDDGASAEAAMKAYDAVHAVKPADGKKSRTQQQEVDAIIGADLSDKEKLAAIKAYTSDSYAEKVQTAYDSGVSLEKWSQVYTEASKIKDGDGTATQKATEFAAYLDRDRSLTEKQKSVLQEQIKFYSQQAADTKRYDSLTEAGMSIDTAEKVYTEMAGIEPLPGSTSVTQAQKVDKILSLDVSEADRWTALKEYTSESWYNKAAEAYRRGIDLDDYVRQFREADLPNDKGETNGQLSQDELWKYYKANQNNETFVKVMWLIGGFKTDWDTYKRKHR